MVKKHIISTLLTFVVIAVLVMVGPAQAFVLSLNIEDNSVELGDDVLAALKAAAKNESNPTAAKILNQLIENAQITD